ncbi:DUF4192 family protein [Streptomyces uncialis]|uniref:DUF4192 family protein n=1 Tax=Streptomyces uncialis TaxID=1048205 RepID=UPI0038073A95
MTSASSPPRSAPLDPHPPRSPARAGPARRPPPPADPHPATDRSAHMTHATTREAFELVLKTITDGTGATLDDNVIRRIAATLHSPAARDAAFGFILPTEIPAALALWQHAADRGLALEAIDHLDVLHTIRAWYLWLSHDRTAALKALHSALAVNPKYVMAQLLAECMEMEEEPPLCLMIVSLEARDSFLE